MMRNNKWEYTIKAYYPSNVPLPHIPNALAIETTHIGKASRDTEIAAFRERMNRNEISHIEVISHVPPFSIDTIYKGTT